MNLKNTKIIHKTLGEGIVKTQDEKYVTIEFTRKTSTFQYPEAFGNFLKAQDEKINEEIMRELHNKEIQKAEEKQRENEERKQQEKAKLVDDIPKLKNAKRTLPQIKRTENNVATFLVFQGNTFDAECRGGFIWAPKYNQGGGKCHHWDRLLDVRKDDFIIHCADGEIKAFSVAKGEYYDAESPRELTEEQLWAKNGRMIDCDYMIINKPIKHSDYKETILEYCNVKYAPFNKNGSGNMGYLYYLDKTLARFFVEKSVMNNTYLLDKESIQKILIR